MSADALGAGNDAEQLEPPLTVGVETGIDKLILELGSLEDIEALQDPANDHLVSDVLRAIKKLKSSFHTPPPRTTNKKPTGKQIDSSVQSFFKVSNKRAQSLRKKGVEVGIIVWKPGTTSPIAIMQSPGMEGFMGAGWLDISNMLPCYMGWRSYMQSKALVTSQVVPPLSSLPLFEQRKVVTAVYQAVVTDHKKYSFTDSEAAEAFRKQHPWWPRELDWQKWSSQHPSTLSAILDLLASIAIDAVWVDATYNACLAATHESAPVVRAIMVRVRAQNLLASATTGTPRCHIKQKMQLSHLTATLR